MPEGGWPAPPVECWPLLARLSEPRRELLHTRGLLALRLPRPAPQVSTAILWLSAPPDTTRTDLLWYTDGSMQHGPTWDLRRTGCGVVVVSRSGDLVAFGTAVPPGSMRTAAAAELWAVLLVLSVAIVPPDIRTDCMSILTAAASGSAKATMPNKMLATLWERIGATLDDDVDTLITSHRLTWVPAHGPMTTIGRALRSDGQTLTAVDWRANRLADALAKRATGASHLCRQAQKVIRQAELLVAHECALLGVVTHAANNHSRVVTDPDGTVRRLTVRDAAALRRPRPSPGPTPAATSAPPAPAPPPTQVAPPVAPSRLCGQEGDVVRQAQPTRHTERAVAARAASQTRAAAGEAATRALCEALASRLRPSSAPPAAERAAALRARVIARQAANAQPGTG